MLRSFPEKTSINFGEGLGGTLCSEEERMRMQRVDKIFEVMAWKMEYDRIKDKLE